MDEERIAGKVDLWKPERQMMIRGHVFLWRGITYEADMALAAFHKWHGLSKESKETKGIILTNPIFASYTISPPVAVAFSKRLQSTIGVWILIES